jgi:transposase InsO family protein
LEVIENYKSCSQFKKSPPRPKVGLPVANDFNDIVGLDLKVISKTKGEYILWMVDLFSKIIKGKFIKNKQPEIIINGIVTSWFIGDGISPGQGHPRRGFWSDSGGEFLNEQVLDFAAAMDINIKMTSAESPWQNGIVERHHATADIIFEKLLKDDPKMNPQESVNHAAFAKNSDSNQTGFSPIQLMTGTNTKFPGLSEATPASSNLDSSSKYMKTLKAIDSATQECLLFDILFYILYN